MAWNTPRTWVAGETETAAIFNPQIRDNFNALATIQTYTPTIAGTGWAKGNGTCVGSYFQAGNRIACFIRFLFGTTSTSGAGGLTFTLPVTPAATLGLAIVGIVKGGSPFLGAGQVQLGTTVNIYSLGVNGIMGQLVSGAPSAGAFGTGDEVRVGWFEYSV